ncbi:tRNA-dihydrouridine(47) synthase [NAD(P)(+)]-like, partial [Dryobates pubescens]
QRFLATKEQFHAYLRARGEPDGQAEAEGEKEKEQEAKEKREEEVGSCQSEPPAKRLRSEDPGEDGESQEDGAEEKEPVERKRARGQNKSRPCMKPNHYEQNRLCPSVTQVGHGEGGADLFRGGAGGSSCSRAVLALSLGKHMEDGASLGQTHRREGKVLVSNSLPKELQHRLRKRRFSFRKAEEYLRALAKPPGGGEKGGKATGSSVEGQELSNCTAPRESLGDGGLQSPDPTGSEEVSSIKTIGPVTDEDVIKLRSCEKRKLEIQGKLYLAPLTTCGNLPFRRVCKGFGADVTCGEMAVCTNLLQGQASEWALLKRHHTEDLFGVQLEGAFPDTMTKCAELLNQTIEVDFVDINVGCPIDLVYKKGGGCALMTRANKFEQIVRGMNSVLDVPLTVKIRTGVQEKVNVAHKIIPRIREWGAAMVTLHGRSREQRYTRSADWEYIAECARAARPMPLFGNGDILSYEDANRALELGVSGVMIARQVAALFCACRGALIKPWLFTEIKEQRHWDISSSQRFDILKDFTNYGLEHWGSDTQGVEKTRKFLLEWLSFLCRYIPVGLLEHLPQKINERPPYYLGRDYLETLMASQNVEDWIKISELLLGPVPANFTFLPKHKANSYR